MRVLVIDRSGDGVDDHHVNASTFELDIGSLTSDDRLLAVGVGEGWVGRGSGLRSRGGAMMGVSSNVRDDVVLQLRHGRGTNGSRGDDIARRASVLATLMMVVMVGGKQEVTVMIIMVHFDRRRSTRSRAKTRTRLGRRARRRIYPVPHTHRTTCNSASLIVMTAATVEGVATVVVLLHIHIHFHSHIRVHSYISTSNTTTASERGDRRRRQPVIILRDDLGVGLGVVLGMAVRGVLSALEGRTMVVLVIAIVVTLTRVERGVEATELFVAALTMMVNVSTALWRKGLVRPALGIIVVGVVVVDRMGIGR